MALFAYGIELQTIRDTALPGAENARGLRSGVDPNAQAVLTESDHDAVAIGCAGAIRRLEAAELHALAVALVRGCRTGIEQRAVERPLGGSVARARSAALLRLPLEGAAADKVYERSA